MNEVLPSVLFDPNLLYVILIAAAWVGVLALFVPGTGIIELLAVVGLLIGIGGVVYSGGNVIGLVLFAASFGLFALAIWRQFSVPALPQPSESGAARTWPLSVWALMIGAAVVQFFGGVVLIGSLPGLSLVTVAVIALGSLAIFRWMLMPTANALRPPPRAGVESLIGERAEVRHAPEAPGKVGTVFLNGELWQAVSDEPLTAGEEVVVLARQGMRLHVRRVAPSDDDGQG